jgi:hypothetical protein
MFNHTRNRSERIKNRVLAQAITLAAAAAAISTLAACGPTTADSLSASHNPAAAQSGSHASSARHHAHRARHRADAPAAPNPGTAASPGSAQPDPYTAAQQTPAKTGSKQGAQHKPQSPSAPAAGVVRFGTVTTDRSTATINVASDRRALTVLFSDLEAGSESGVLSNGTRMAIPLTGGAPNATLKVFVSGYVFTHRATARLSVTVNGQSIVKDFPSRTDHDFILPIYLSAIGGSAYQLSLTIDEQPNSGRGAAYINVNAIDSEIT